MHTTASVICVHQKLVLRFLHKQSMTHIFVEKEGVDVKQTSPTGQDMFWPIPGLVRYAGVTRRWGLLSHTKRHGYIHMVGSSGSVYAMCKGQGSTTSVEGVEESMKLIA